jgi:hypothetical protein
MQIVDADNLAVRSSINLPENFAGKSILSSDGNTIYGLSDSGVLVLPVGSFGSAHQVTATRQDMVFRGNFCDRKVATQNLTITNPGGGSVAFTVTSSSPGVSVSPSSGVTPMVVRVTVDPNVYQNQKGTSAVALTVTSSASRTSPVVRGKWVLETLLGEKTPEPPADAGALDPEAGEKRNKTLRQELLDHRRNASCAMCHNKIDPIGFGLENFDAIGRYRTEEAGQPVDNSGELPGGAAFRGPAELKKLLLAKRKSAFIRNVVERMLSFALGRKLELFDEPAIAGITAAVEADGYRAATLVKQIVLSYPFQNQNNKDTVE